MKKCFKCRRRLPLSEFYAHPAMSDGHLGKCKACAKKDVRENRAKRREYYNEKDRERASKGLPRRLAWQKKNKLIRIAHRIVTKALKAGKIRREKCQVCGDPKALAHHEDYSKPLDVRWLCQTHHRRRHAEMRAAGIDVLKTARR